MASRMEPSLVFGIRRGAGLNRDPLNEVSSARAPTKNFSLFHFEREILQLSLTLDLQHRSGAWFELSRH